MLPFLNISKAHVYIFAVDSLILALQQTRQKYIHFPLLHFYSYQKNIGSFSSLFCKMKFQSVSAFVGLLSIAAAATTTTSSVSSSSTSLSTAVSKLPTCAQECLPTVGTEIGCSVGDFECMCSSSGSLVAHMGTCILKKNDCSSDDITSMWLISANYRVNGLTKSQRQKTLLRRSATL